MRAALTRPRLTLWAAWVAAAAIGTGAAVLMNLYLYRQAPPEFVGPIVLALPLVTLQYLVLRLVSGVPANGAGLWVVLSLFAAVATPMIDSVWVFSVAPYHFPTVTRLVPSLSTPDFTLGALRVIDPLVIGIAQGAALARILGSFRFGIAWTAVSVIASLIAQQFLVSVVMRLGIPAVPFVLPLLVINVAFSVAYAALSGVALVVILISRPRPAPAPAV